MTKILGIDEAARGPCIGSLFIAGALIDEKDIPKLKKLGVKDSKLLTHKKRVELEGKLKKVLKHYLVIQVKPEEIDEAIDGNNTLNLNWLEAVKSAEIINELKPDKAILDCPSPNIEKYKNFVKKLLNNNVELVVEHKADTLWRIVGAASILAKCEREKEMDEIKKKYGNCGPGYTSNEITQKFIKENFDKYPEIFRRSWSTWKNHDGAKKQKSLSDF
ncbi:MAG: ribonuclease HII [Nanoarchaeota archaeon]|nr:ribonuclease HII [Nanoarchaeota archaeon]